MRHLLISICFLACSQTDRAAEPQPITAPSPAAAPAAPTPDAPARRAACARGTPAAHNDWTSCQAQVAATLATGEVLCFATEADACECNCGVPDCSIGESNPPQAFCSQ